MTYSASILSLRSTQCNNNRAVSSVRLQDAARTYSAPARPQWRPTRKSGKVWPGSPRQQGSLNPAWQGQIPARKHRCLLSARVLCVGGLAQHSEFGSGEGGVKDAPQGPRRPGCLATCPASPPSRTRRSPRQNCSPNRKRRRRRWSSGLLAGSQAAPWVLALALAPAGVPALVLSRVLWPAGTRSGTALQANARLLVSAMQALAAAYTNVPGTARARGAAW